MDLVKGFPYFTNTKKQIRQFPYLNKNISCDVLIVGGGIDGAITSYFLAESGIDVVVVDKNRFGHCSTSCATALLEYQLDEHAEALKPYLTESEIVEIYKLGLGAINTLDNLIKKIDNKCHFSLRPTLVFTTKKTEVEKLEKEYYFRIKHGFKAQLLNKNTNPFTFHLESGILCGNGGAEFNPYLFTKQMFYQSKKLGAKLFENTEIVKIEYFKDKVFAHTKYGYQITCKKIICATGYNTSLFSENDLCDKYCSYSIVTSPIKKINWQNKTLLHDSADPYHYIRLTHDKRIIIGGEDHKINGEIDVEKAKEKYEVLNEFLQNLFPSIKNLYTIDYKFCGYFGTTLNNLGVVGPTQKKPNLWYMLGYGANGIINTIYGAQMLRDLYHGKKHKHLYLFSPDRKIF